MYTRIREVVSAEKVNWRHTRVLPVTVAPGMVCQPLAVQYCTSKSRKPYWLKVIDCVGSAGDAKLSCTENTSTSAMVWLPLKSTSNQSGKAPAVPSFQPPPLPQERPLRSPLIAPL